MARSVIEIPIASETGAFEKGIKTGVIKPLEDAEKALDDLADARGPEQLERAMRDTQKQTERLKDETRKTSTAIEDNFTRAYRESKKAADDGLDGMSRKGQEVGEELRANLGETFSSFRGDLEDLPQIAQDTLGGLAGSGALGGIGGLAATAAGAAGLGLVIGAFEQIDEAAQLSRERVDSWASAFTEAGAKVLDASIIQSRMNDILTDTDGKLKEAKTNASNWGASIEDAVLAMAGHQPTIDKIRDSLKEQGESFVEVANKGKGLTSQQLEAFKAYQDGAQAFRSLTSEMAEGASVIDIQSAALINLINATSGATKEVDDLGNAVYKLPDGTEIFIDAQTGQASQNVEKFKGDVDGVPERVTTQIIAKATVDDSAIRNYRPPVIQLRGEVAVPRGSVVVY